MNNIQSMVDVRPRIFEFYATAFSPGTLDYCTCAAGPRHLVGLLPDSDEWLHFSVAPNAYVVLLIGSR